MALDPDIILQAGKFQSPDLGQTLQLRELISGRRDAAAQAAQERALAAAAQQRRAQVGGMAASGDVEGAGNAALSAGDFDLYGHIKGLQDEQRAAVKRRVDAAAPIAYQAAQLPYELRRGAIAAAAPQLVANGWKPEEIAQFDPTDEALGSLVASAQDINGMLSRHDAELKAAQAANEAQLNRENSRGNAWISAGALPPGEEGPAAPVAPQTGKGALASTQLASLALKGIPNARITSMNRTPEHNAEVGGVPNSQHVRGTAIDFVAPNMSKADVESYFRQQGAPVTVIEHDAGSGMHFHVQAAAGAAPSLPGGVRPIPGGKLDPSAKKEPASAKPPAGYRWTPSGNLEAIPGGPGDKQGRQANLKPPPNKALVDYQENVSSLANVQQALSLLDPKNAKPEAQRARSAIGPGTGMLGSTFTQLNDPAGGDFRALLGRIGGIIIKDTSGAAVTASEDARLSQWVPKPSDTIEAARSKLRNLANAIQNNNAAFAEIYNEDNGYRPLRMRGTLSPKPVQSAHPPEIQAILDKYR